MILVRQAAWKPIRSAKKEERKATRVFMSQRTVLHAK